MPGLIGDQAYLHVVGAVHEPPYGFILWTEVLRPVDDKRFDIGEFLISTDRSKLDLNLIHSFLTKVYWAQGIPLETVKRSMDNSLCFGIHRGENQVGFGRVITDYATFAYIGDVFILESYRGRRLAKWLIENMMAHPDLQGLRRWMLATRDAHDLYAPYGFTLLKSPDRWMEKHDPEVYRK